MRFSTETGSLYELQVFEEGWCVRRVNESAEKRADGEWKRLLKFPLILKGHSVVLVMEGLGGYGPDDEGHRTGPGGITTRTTSRVLDIWP